MEEQNITPDNKQNTGRHNACRYFTPVSIIICIIALIGLSLGIYNSIQTNHILDVLAENNFIASDTGSAEDEYDDSEDEEDVEMLYGKPNSAAEIISTSIEYNNLEDEIYIDDGYIDYYNINDEDGDGITADIETNEINQYIMDNVISNLNDNEDGEDISDETTWAITVSSDNGYAYASGTGETPNWLKGLIDKANSYRPTSK